MRSECVLVNTRMTLIHVFSKNSIREKREMWQQPSPLGKRNVEMFVKDNGNTSFINLKSSLFWSTAKRFNE